jgi:hypothetical protein
VKHAGVRAGTWAGAAGASVRMLTPELDVWTLVVPSNNSAKAGPEGVRWVRPPRAHPK